MPDERLSGIDTGLIGHIITYSSHIVFLGDLAITRNSTKKMKQFKDIPALLDNIAIDSGSFAIPYHASMTENRHENITHRTRAGQAKTSI